jgi:hypothetical protein
VYQDVDEPKSLLGYVEQLGDVSLSGNRLHTITGREELLLMQWTTTLAMDGWMAISLPIPRTHLSRWQLALLKAFPFFSPLPRRGLAQPGNPKP